MRFEVYLLVFVFCLGCSSDSQKDSADIGSVDVAADLQLDIPNDMGLTPFVVEQTETGIAIRESNRELVLLTGVQGLRFTPEVTMTFGFFDHEKVGEDAVEFDLGLDGADVVFTSQGEEAGRMVFEKTPSGELRGKIQLKDKFVFTGMRLAFDCTGKDTFWGFGGQYNFVDLKGQTVPIWVSEQGVGRSPEPASLFEGSYTESYFPMPYFLNRERGMGFLLENSEYSLFDMCDSDKNVWSMEVWSGKDASFLIFPGPTAKEVVTQLTDNVGRPGMRPPDWAFDGVWLAAQGGTEAVMQRVDTALDAGIAVTAVWVQDWVGLRNFGADNFGVKYRWIHDTELYPDLPETIAELEAKGIRFLGYFNNFVVPDFSLYETADAEGYLIQQANGKAYTFPITVFEGSILDVTNPKAVDWFKGYAKTAVDMGMAGWMCDFGEWLPFDAKIHQGSAAAFHNLYPTAWHKASREVLSIHRPGGDFVLLTRSGFTGEHKVAQIVWAGDQEADWSKGDGISTVVKAGLTLGMSGIPFFTHEIAGFSGGPSTKELFMRWTELAAFTPFMRTHDGLKKLENHRFDSDSETLSHFADMVNAHVAMAPLFKELANEAVQTGLPIIRHTALVDPDWLPAQTAHGQWMLGDDVVFAPIVEEGQTMATVHLPAGSWVHVVGGVTEEGRKSTIVSAEIGEPAVYFRSGTHEDVLWALKEAL